MAILEEKLKLDLELYDPKTEEYKTTFIQLKDDFKLRSSD